MLALYLAFDKEKGNAKSTRTTAEGFIRHRNLCHLRERAGASQNFALTLF